MLEARDLDALEHRIHVAEVARQHSQPHASARGVEERERVPRPERDRRLELLQPLEPGQMGQPFLVGHEVVSPELLPARGSSAPLEVAARGVDRRAELARAFGPDSGSMSE